MLPFDCTEYLLHQNFGFCHILNVDIEYQAPLPNFTVATNTYIHAGHLEISGESGVPLRRLSAFKDHPTYLL